MTIEIYKNYGVLAAEKRSVYTYGGPHFTAITSDLITVEIPAEWDVFENHDGELIVTAPWGTPYTINEVLGGDSRPEFSAVDGNNKLRRVALRVISGN